MRQHAFRHRLNDALEVIKPIGWMVLGIGLGATFVATFTQWRELAVLGLACVILLGLALPFLLGRTAVSVDLRLQPERVAAGESVAAGVLVVNKASTRLVPTTLEVPVARRSTATASARWRAAPLTRSRSPSAPSGVA